VAQRSRTRAGCEERSKAIQAVTYSADWIASSAVSAWRDRGSRLLAMTRNARAFLNFGSASKAAPARCSAPKRASPPSHHVRHTTDESAPVRL
jgi:hypothetical protein